VGGAISPLLANLYLHYVFDLWVNSWRQKRAQGQVIVVRYADDFIVGFQKKEDAERFRVELQERLQKFHLDLHPEKTRLLEFGRHAARNRARRGEGRPETFDFLGFTHCCSRTGKKKGFLVVRRTMRKRLQRKLQEIKAELRKRMHTAVPEQAAYLRSVLWGHYAYYGVSWNGPSLRAFRRAVSRTWMRTLRRRSQRHRLTWKRIWEWTDRWLPKPRIYHSYPWSRICVNTRGGSRMR
jgi:RNA-directed DNA polymerase